MTLAELLAKLDAEDLNRDELKNEITNYVKSVEEKGKQAYSKKDKELLKFKSALKDAGWDNEKYSDVKEFVSSLKKKDEKITTSDVTIAQLNEKLNELTSSLEQERAIRTEAERTAKQSKLTAELTNAIGKDFYGAEYLIKDLVRDGKVNLAEDGSVVFKNGDDIVTFDNGINQLKEQHKDMLRVDQVGGSGKNGGVNAGIDVSILEKPAEEVLETLGL